MIITYIFCSDEIHLRMNKKGRRNENRKISYHENPREMNRNEFLPCSYFTLKKMATLIDDKIGAMQCYNLFVNFSKDCRDFIFNKKV